MDQTLRDVALEAPGFMPDDEGVALYAAALQAPAQLPWLEIGSYCGKSAVYLGSAASRRGTVLFTVDHHRGSEENQPGEEYHDPRLYDEAVDRMDSLPAFRRTIADAGLEDVVVAVVGTSSTVARWWRTPLALLFIDGGHSAEAVCTDYECWTPHLVQGGLLAIHDVFVDPACGGRPPFDVYTEAIQSGAFEECSAHGSLRVLCRIGDG